MTLGLGRAARNVDGRVIMYADRITGSMERAMKETERRREKQEAYNEAHGITPQTIKKNVEDVLDGVYKGDTCQTILDVGKHHLRRHSTPRVDCADRLRSFGIDVGKPLKISFRVAGRNP